MLLMAITDLKPILSFLLASIALLASPGPATVALAASGASFGLRRSLNFYFGIVVGLIPAIALVAGGVFVTLRAVPIVSSVLFTASIAYILYLAVKIASAPPLSDSEQEVASPGFPSGFILGITNVKAYAVFAALFGGFALDISDQWDVLIKAAICMAVIVVFDFLWLATGSNLRHFFTNPVLSRIVNVGLAALMLAMVVWSVWRS